MVEVQKLKNLNYDELITLALIELDQDLSEMFTDEIKIPFNILRTLAKEDKLSNDTKVYLKVLFDKIILTKTNLISKYVSLAEADGKKIYVIETPVEEIPEPVVSKPIKKKKEKVLPRRYGKSAIDADIKKQGGKPTNVQLTGLAINELKNITVVLSGKIINDMLTDNPKLSEEDYRGIRATITLLKNRLKTVLKKK